MNADNDVFIAVVALLIVAGICLGLLMALAIYILGRRDSSPSQGSQYNKIPGYHEWLGENEPIKRPKL